MLLVVLLLACGDKGGDDTAGGDGGAADGGVGDGGATDGGTGDGGTPPAGVLAVAAASGDLGAIAWLTSWENVDLADVIIQAERDGAWVDACTGEERCILAESASKVRAVTSDGLVSSSEVAPRSLTVSLSLSREDRAWWADEIIGFTLNASLSDAPAGVYLQRVAWGETRWWNPDEGWVGTPTTVDPETLAVTPYANSVTKAVYTALIGVPVAEWGTEEDMSGIVVAGLRSADNTVFELGHRVLWGDPHVHTDLSQDGCEDAESGCQGPDTEPAADVFLHAEESGLDWATIADHAEKTTYIGSPEAAEIDVWGRQQELVQEADGSTVIPFLGYEWTYASEAIDEDLYREGGHRTVMLEETSACNEWRIGATSNAPDHDKGWSSTVILTTNPVYALTPVAMRDALTAAAEVCDDQRALFIAHHPGLKKPQPVDWRREANRPEPTWETVVEIASEHGTSECFELSDPHCAWRVYDEDDYYPQGSFQAALRQGYRLGVAGGTDTHDARAGSIEDGPSCTAVPLSETELACQNYQGATTGVLTADPYDRHAIFDGIFDRKTYATTGPQIPVRAWLTVGEDLYLPGRAVKSEGERSLTVSLAEAYDADQWTTVAIDLLNEQGEILDAIEAAATDERALLQTIIEPGDCTACYVRIRLYEEGDAEGERIWLSPWFF